MAIFDKSYELLEEYEFNNDPQKFLHKNRTEETETLGGIYRHQNPNAIDWAFVDELYKICNFDMSRASVLLYCDSKTVNQVKNFFKKNYWDVSKLDEVHSQKIADEIFLCSVLCGVKTASKMAQKLVGAVEDGIIGDISVKCLNNTNAGYFDIKYDELEKDHFDNIVSINPELKIYLSGWKSRADKV